MKIGLLAYHSACNFGATLQLLSTYMYLKNHGYEPIVINWIAKDLEEFYIQKVPKVQIDNQIKLREVLWNETALCRTSEDVAKIIEQEKIEAVIIGSDAVAQHHPLLERLTFPCRKIVVIKKYTSDREYPNPFWAVWEDFLDKKIPVAVMSASCQDSEFRYISPKLKKELKKRICSYSYISVRDVWTREMISYLTDKNIISEVTPDPVFAFNENVNGIIPTREEILKKYNIQNKYILISFIDSSRKSIGQEWIDSFVQLALEAGYECISLPFSHGKSFGHLRHEICLPLTPIDWYALIKYSCGYIGNNMHPIVVCLHNAVPFYSFDNYGKTRLNGIIGNDKSSKIKHILNLANLSQYRTSCISRKYKVPSSQTVFDKVISFDKSISEKFAGDYLKKYNNMMSDILERITKK